MRIRKKYQVIPTNAKLENGHSDSDKNGYTCEYINSLNEYSTDEIRIGTWTDGKPIYRRVFYGTATSTSAFIIGTISNIGALVNMRGYYRNGVGYWTSLFQYWDSNLKNVVQVNATNGRIELNAGSDVLNKNYVFIVEYTKTTD